MSVKGLARDQDECFGVCTHSDHYPGTLPQKGKITATAVNSTCNGKSVAREGDIVTGDICGHTGVIDPLPDSASKAENKALAFVTHTFSGVYSGTITKGSEDSEVGI